jgi:hypothetical protein
MDLKRKMKQMAEAKSFASVEKYEKRLVTQFFYGEAIESMKMHKSVT